jgi:phosphoserine aminotransferase
MPPLFPASTDFMKPQLKPANPNFSSGPCAKRPGYNLQALRQSALGRSHRSKLGLAVLGEALEKTREILQIPDDYRIGIVPASDTGAFELAMWSMLGERPVDIFSWESFGGGWASDIAKQLKLEGATHYEADYGLLPDLSEANPQHDIVFTLNGTTSGVCVPDLDWISDTRSGVTLCDATSGIFAMDVDWSKLDVTTFSWQKVLGGEAAHGILILSPHAVKRLESYTPPWPLPKIFRLTKGGKLNESIFKGSTINTPSMLCVEDYIDALNWVSSLGGLLATIARSQSNLNVLENFVAERDWVSFLAQDERIRSRTSVCLTLALEEGQVKELVKLLDEEGVAYDIGSYRDAPSGLRIWCGATVESSDLEALMPWLDWAYSQVNQ